MELVTDEITSTLPNIRAGILAVESVMCNMPDVMYGDCLPLKHTFADGMYIREITVPKGMLLVTKIHKLTHPFFLLRGECSILTERGVERIKAPYSGITQAGTKRIVYTHEHTIWTTIHATKETDLDKIEEDIIAKTYGEMGLEVGEINTEGEESKLIEFIKTVTVREGEMKCLG